MLAERDAGRGAGRGELLERARQRCRSDAGRREPMRSTRRGDARRCRQCRISVRSSRARRCRAMSREASRSACGLRADNSSGAFGTARVSGTPSSCPPTSSLFLVARQYRVRIGAAETECADADDEAPVGCPERAAR